MSRTSLLLAVYAVVMPITPCPTIASLSDEAIGSHDDRSDSAEPIVENALAAPDTILYRLSVSGGVGWYGQPAMSFLAQLDIGKGAYYFGIRYVLLKSVVEYEGWFCDGSCTGLGDPSGDELGIVYGYVNRSGSSTLSFYAGLGIHFRTELVSAINYGPYRYQTRESSVHPAIPFGCVLGLIRGKWGRMNLGIDCSLNGSQPFVQFNLGFQIGKLSS